MNRRQFIKNLLVSRAHPGLLSIPFVLTPSTSRAEPVTTITTAITVVKAIVDANRGDGGLGASLTSINGKLDVAIRQLASIQQSVAYLVSEVAKLRKDLFDALGQQYGYELRNEVITSIRKIEDIRLEAKLKNVSLAANNPNRATFPVRLRSAYETFDHARRRLWTPPEATATGASTICSACLGVDAFAFGAGLVDDVQFAITLRGHLQWLDKMVDSAQPLSVAAELAIAQEREKQIVASAQEKARKNDAASMIAYRLYSASPIRLCVISKIDGLFYSSMAHAWLRTGETTSILVAEFSRDAIDKSGATLLTNVRSANRYVAHYKPNGFAFIEMPQAAAINRSTCISEALPDVRFDAVTLARLRVDTSDRDEAWKTISPTIFGHVRNVSPAWTAWTSEATWRAAQRILDEVSAERLKQVYAATCLEHVQQQRLIARSMQAQFPKVGEASPRLK